VATTAGRDARVERTVSKVLAAVHRLLETEGLGSVTFGRVSRETGVSRTTLYRHWSSPSMLISDAWAEVAPSNKIAHTTDLYDDLVRLFLAVRNVAESATMRRSLPVLLVSAQRDPVISSLHAEFVRARRQPIIERLRAGIAEGQLVADANPDLLVDLVSGPIFYRQLLRRERTSDDDVRAIVAAALASVRPPT
jgi:AcrR family transcriptional regulator